MESMFSKIVTTRKDNKVKIAKMETLKKSDLVTLKFKVNVDGNYIGNFNTRKDMANFMINKFYFGEI